MNKIEAETVQDVLRSLEGKTVTHGEPDDLIWRLANAVDRELDVMHERIEELERMLGL